MQTTPGDENETTTNSIKQQNNDISFTKVPYHHTETQIFLPIKVGLSIEKNCLLHSKQTFLLLKRDLKRYLHSLFT